MLFDTGMGTSQMFGPTPGKMMANLKAAGIDPKDIDAVVATHAHCDHVWGIMGDDGKPNFPNAQIYISQADFDYWTDEAKLGLKDPAFMKAFVEGARKNLLPVRDRIVFVKDGQEFLPGIQAISAPGHTVGHMVYMVTSDGKSLAAIGDLTHHQVLLVEKPRIEFAFDTDPKQSANSRVRILDMLAAQRIPLIAYHFPWPGVGTSPSRATASSSMPRRCRWCSEPSTQRAGPSTFDRARPSRAMHWRQATGLRRQRPCPPPATPSSRTSSTRCLRASMACARPRAWRSPCPAAGTARR